MLFIATGIFRTQMLAADTLQPQLLNHLLQKAQALAQRIYQCHLKLGAVNFQRHTGKAGASAHVCQGFSGHLRLVGQQAVYHMLYGNILRLGNSGKVHHLIGFHQQLVITAELLQLQRRKAQTGLRTLFG